MQRRFSGTCTGGACRWWRPCWWLPCRPPCPSPWFISPPTASRWSRTRRRNILCRWLHCTLFEAILSSKWKVSSYGNVFAFSPSFFVLMESITQWRRRSLTHLRGVWGVCFIVHQVSVWVGVICMNLRLQLGHWRLMLSEKQHMSCYRGSSVQPYRMSECVGMNLYVNLLFAAAPVPGAL